MGQEEELLPEGFKKYELAELFEVINIAWSLNFTPANAF